MKFNLVGISQWIPLVFEFDSQIYHQKLLLKVQLYKVCTFFYNILLLKVERKMLNEYHLDLLAWWHFLDNFFSLFGFMESKLNLCM